MSATSSRAVRISTGSRSPRARSAAQHREAVLAGQADVEDQQVEVVVARDRARPARRRRTPSSCSPRRAGPSRGSSTAAARPRRSGCGSRAPPRRRGSIVNVAPAPGPADELDAAVVGLGDRADDGQAEARRPPSAGGWRSARAKRSNTRSWSARRDARARCRAPTASPRRRRPRCRARSRRPRRCAGPRSAPGPSSPGSAAGGRPRARPRRAPRAASRAAPSARALSSSSSVSAPSSTSPTRRKSSRSARASSSRSSTKRLMRSSSSVTSAIVSRRSCGSSPSSSRWPRTIVIGVRSSWLASLTNERCVPNAASSRSSMALNVRAEVGDLVVAGRRGCGA